MARGSHKPIGIYMRGLILGIIIFTYYTNFLFWKISVAWKVFNVGTCNWIQRREKACFEARLLHIRTSFV